MARKPRAGRPMKEKKELPSFLSANTVPFKVPEVKFKKAGVSYNKGDRIHIKEAEGEYFGVIKDILASQIIVRPDGCDDPGCEKFFFTTGIKISKC